MGLKDKKLVPMETKAGVGLGRNVTFILLVLVIKSILIHVHTLHVHVVCDYVIVETDLAMHVTFIFRKQ